MFSARKEKQNYKPVPSFWSEPEEVSTPRFQRETFAEQIYYKLTEESVLFRYSFIKRREHACYSSRPASLWFELNAGTEHNSSKYINTDYTIFNYNNTNYYK